MAIAYKVVSKKQPGKDAVKYYAVPKRQGSVTLDDIANDMAAESTVTAHDVKAVLSSLQDWIARYLKLGMSVRLGDLGSFHVTFSGEGADQKADYTIDNLKSVRVQFTKSGKLMRMFRTENLSFRNVEDEVTP